MQQEITATGNRKKKSFLNFSLKISEQKELSASKQIKKFYIQLKLCNFA